MKQNVKSQIETDIFNFLRYLIIFFNVNNINFELETVFYNSIIIDAKTIAIVHIIFLRVLQVIFTRYILYQINSFIKNVSVQYIYNTLSTPFDFGLIITLSFYCFIMVYFHYRLCGMISLENQRGFAAQIVLGIARINASKEQEIVVIYFSQYFLLHAQHSVQPSILLVQHFRYLIKMCRFTFLVLILFHYYLDLKSKLRDSLKYNKYYQV